MDRSVLQTIHELYRLWEPVYPHLARHIREEYGRDDGHILEAGPFCGVLFALKALSVGERHTLAVFPPELCDFFRREGNPRGNGQTPSVLASDDRLSNIETESINLLIFRGAFFFPRLFSVDLRGIERVLKRGGTAFVGGGFGKYTPPHIIEGIARRSKELNAQLGRVSLPADILKGMAGEAGLLSATNIVTDGGLWMKMTKPARYGQW